MIEIVPLQPVDEPAARALILSGLAERWGALDPGKNPDLRHPLQSYATGLFLVARRGGQVVGTGAFRPLDAQTVEIVRMSVARPFRRQGIGRAILSALCQAAKARGYQRAVLETTRTWHDAIAFYRAFGFQPTHCTAEDQYFALDLKSGPLRLTRSCKNQYNPGIPSKGESNEQTTQRLS